MNPRDAGGVKTSLPQPLPSREGDIQKCGKFPLSLVGEDQGKENQFSYLIINRK